MDRNSVPPKTKMPPSKESDEDSDEESETSDEETEDEEQAEGGSDFESESDKSTDATKKKLTSILPTKQQSAVKAAAPAAPAAAPGSPAKRTREVNGKKDKEDEPPNKRKKPEAATPAKSAAPKPTAPQSDKKKESASKAKPATPAKEKPSKESTAEKETRKSTKRKPQSPAAKSDASKPSTSNKSDGETPQKTNKPSRPWLPEEELTLSKEIQKDRVFDVYGASLPAARADPYWEKLISRLSFMDKYEKDYRVERLCEKVRRMRLRYESLLTRVKAGETNVWKNVHEGDLWRIWHTIWGPNKATQGMLNGDGNEEEEEEEEEEEDDEEEEDEDEEDEEEDEVEPTQAKGRQSTAATASAQKKVISKKKVESSSDDDESNREETPVKATPPAVLAAPAVPAAAAAATVAEKQPSASKSVPAKDPAPTAMEVDLNTSGNDTSQRVAVHNGAPAVAAVPKVVLSDELRAENLAFLRDMRGTCVKMVEEAKTQSLIIVEEARAKSSQIMEELRMVVERLGAMAGQNGRMNGSGINFSENPFQGGSLLLGNGALPMGDQSELEDRWREQSEAEQGLLLQRLQLVQEQARVQQEGIRLNIAKLNLQKQHAKAQDKA